MARSIDYLSYRRSGHHRRRADLDDSIFPDDNCVIIQDLPILRVDDIYIGKGKPNGILGALTANKR